MPGGNLGGGVMGETPPLILLWGFQMSHHEQGAPFLNRKKKKVTREKRQDVQREESERCHHSL